jgi:hypothetical protein
MHRSRRTIQLDAAAAIDAMDPDVDNLDVEARGPSPTRWLKRNRVYPAGPATATIPDNDNGNDGLRPLGSGRRVSFLAGETSAEDEWVDVHRKRLCARNNVRKNMSWFKLQLYDLRAWLYVQRMRRRDPIPIWRTRIKRIEDTFGSGVSGFFVFARFLLLNNMALSVLFFSFLLLPMSLAFDYTAPVETFGAENIINGRGILGETFLFYGGFTKKAGIYSMSLAYVCILLLGIWGSLFAITRKIVQALAENGIFRGNRRTDGAMPFGAFVFSSWDYTINAPLAVKGLHRGLVSAIRDGLVEIDGKNRLRQQMTSRETWRKVQCAAELGTKTNTEIDPFYFSDDIAAGCRVVCMACMSRALVFVRMVPRTVKDRDRSFSAAVARVWNGKNSLFFFCFFLWV